MAGGVHAHARGTQRRGRWLCGRRRTAWVVCTASQWICLPPLTAPLGASPVAKRPVAHSPSPPRALLAHMPRMAHSRVEDSQDVGPTTSVRRINMLGDCGNRGGPQLVSKPQRLCVQHGASAHGGGPWRCPPRPQRIWLPRHRLLPPYVQRCVPHGACASLLCRALQCFSLIAPVRPATASTWRAATSCPRA